MVRFVVGQNLASAPLPPGIDALLKSGTIGMACKLPWERMVVSGGTHHHHQPHGGDPVAPLWEDLPGYQTSPAPAPAPPMPPMPEPKPPARRVIHPRIIKERPLARMPTLVDQTGKEVAGPGCTAADSTLLAHGYVTELAAGKEGFGVLRLGKEKMEEGAAAARILGERELAGEMLAIAGDLPDVHDAEAAQRMANRLKPVIDSTWELARRCKEGLPTLPSPEQSERVRDLAIKVQVGEITMGQAIDAAREEVA